MDPNSPSLYYVPGPPRVKTGVIYKLSFPSGKVYIGQTTKNPKKRWHLHRVRANHCWYLARAIKRHGWENVKKEVLVELPSDQLNVYEAKFIAAYGCIRPGGYNLTAGGDYNPMNDARIRQRQLEKVQDQKHREAQRDHSKKWHTDPIKHKKWLKRQTSPEAMAKRHAAQMRKREERLAKFPPEKREAERRRLEKNAAMARAKYVPRRVRTGSSA